MLENLVTDLREVSGTGPVPPGPTFGGESDVEQFIRDFKDVATIAERPAPHRIVKGNLLTATASLRFAL